MQALGLAGIFFLLSFHPSAAIPIFVMAGIEGKGYSWYDRWILDLVQRHSISKKSVLVLTPKTIKSELAKIYWPGENEQNPPENMIGFYGLVVVDAPEYSQAIPYRLLSFCFAAMEPGGLLLVTENRKIIIQARKP